MLKGQIQSVEEQVNVVCTHRLTVTHRNTFQCMHLSTHSFVHTAIHTNTQCNTASHAHMHVA